MNKEEYEKKLIEKLKKNFDILETVKKTIKSSNECITKLRERNDGLIDILNKVVKQRDYLTKLIENCEKCPFCVKGDYDCFICQGTKVIKKVE